MKTQKIIMLAISTLSLTNVFYAKGGGGGSKSSNSSRSSTSSGFSGGRNRAAPATRSSSADSTSSFSNRVHSSNTQSHLHTDRSDIPFPSRHRVPPAAKPSTVSDLRKEYSKHNETVKTAAAAAGGAALGSMVSNHNNHSFLPWWMWYSMGRSHSSHQNDNSSSYANQYAHTKTDSSSVKSIEKSDANVLVEQQEPLIEQIGSKNIELIEHKKPSRPINRFMASVIVGGVCGWSIWSSQHILNLIKTQVKKGINPHDVHLGTASFAALFSSIMTYKGLEYIQKLNESSDSTK